MIINAGYNYTLRIRRAYKGINLHANLGAINSDGYTPLHLAALTQGKDIMALLLTPRAIDHINDKDPQGRTAYRIAKEMDKEDVAELLKNAGANTEI